LSFATEQFAPADAGARYNAQFGENGPTIEVQTQNGSILVQSADTTTTEMERKEPSTVPSDTGTVDDASSPEDTMPDPDTATGPPTPDTLQGPPDTSG
jgi:hypothetical protein